MDDGGRFWADPVFKSEAEKAAGRRLDIKTGKPAKMAMEINNKEIATALAGMPRKIRRIYMAERRRGKPEEAAFKIAMKNTP